MEAHCKGGTNVDCSVVGETSPRRPDSSVLCDSFRNAESAELLRGAGPGPGSE